jgi:hypothetical protein
MVTLLILMTFLSNMEKETTGNEPRTLSQNAALHLYCKQVADECLETGVTLKTVVDAVQTHGIYPDEENIKTFFRALGKAKYGKDSTAKLTKLELQDIYLTLRQALLGVGIFTEFPSQEGQSANDFYQTQI